MFCLYCPVQSVKAFCACFKKKIIPIYILKKPPDRLQQMSSGKGWCSCCEQGCSLLPIFCPPTLMPGSCMSPHRACHRHSGLRVGGLRCWDTSFHELALQGAGMNSRWCEKPPQIPAVLTDWQTAREDSKYIQAVAKLQPMNLSSLHSALTVWVCLTVKLLSLFIPRLATGLGDAL